MASYFPEKDAILRDIAIFGLSPFQEMGAALVVKQNCTSKLFKMTKKIFLLFAAALIGHSAAAQTLRIRSYSLENLQLSAVGTDGVGHHTSKTFYDVSMNGWKVVSLNEVKYGYDNYNNQEMKHEGSAGTDQWTSLVVFNNSTTERDVIDLTRSADRVHLAHANVWAKVKRRYDRNYIITEVVLNDE